MNSMITLSAASEHILPQAIDVSFLRLVFCSLRSDGLPDPNGGSDACVATVTHLPSPAEFVKIATSPPRIPLLPAAAVLFSPLSTSPNHASYSTFVVSLVCTLFCVSLSLVLYLLSIRTSRRFAGTGVRLFFPEEIFG